MDSIEKIIDGWMIRVDFGEFLPNYNAYRAGISIRPLPNGQRFGSFCIITREFVEDTIAFDQMLCHRLDKMKKQYPKA